MILVQAVPAVLARHGMPGACAGRQVQRRAWGGCTAGMAHSSMPESAAAESRIARSVSESHNCPSLWHRNRRPSTMAAMCEGALTRSFPLQVGKLSEHHPLAGTISFVQVTYLRMFIL